MSNFAEHYIEEVTSDRNTVTLKLSDGVVIRVNTNYGNTVHVSVNGCDLPIKVGYSGLESSHYQLSNNFDIMYGQVK